MTIGYHLLCQWRDDGGMALAMLHFWMVQTSRIIQLGGVILGCPHTPPQLLPMHSQSPNLNAVRLSLAHTMAVELLHPAQRFYGN